MTISVEPVEQPQGDHLTLTRTVAVSQGTMEETMHTMEILGRMRQDELLREAGDRRGQRLAAEGRPTSNARQPLARLVRLRR